MTNISFPKTLNELLYDIIDRKENKTISADKIWKKILIIDTEKIYIYNGSDLEV